MKKHRIKQWRFGDPIPEGIPSRTFTAAGYARLRWTVAPYELVEVYEHRAVAGWPPPDLQVHHMNGNRADNRPENLEVLTLDEHSAHHGQENRTWDRDYAAGLYRTWWTTTEIADLFGTDAANISRGLRAHGVTMRTVSEAQRFELPEHIVRPLAERGVSSRRIAKELGVSAALVQTRLREWGVPRRRPGNLTRVERESVDALIAEVMCG